METDPRTKRTLYATLIQVVRAYMIGAGLAALALCRSATQHLIRYHYAHDIPNAKDSRKTKLTGRDSLIEKIEGQNRFSFLKRFNLTQNVMAAHEILHMKQQESVIEHRDADRGLVLKWVRELQEMIDRIPSESSSLK